MIGRVVLENICGGAIVFLSIFFYGLHRETRHHDPAEKTIIPLSQGEHCTSSRRPR